jgi:hypothetical protein
MKRLVPSLIMISLLAACAGPIETRVMSDGQAGPITDNYVFAETAEAQSPELLQARALVVERLGARGLDAVETAALQLEVTLSSRAAILGLKQGNQVLSAPKPKKPFQSCKDREYRIGIALTRIADGAEIYRASAAVHHCKVSLAEAVPSLVNAALADLGAPKGHYVVKRRGRE